MFYASALFAKNETFVCYRKLGQTSRTAKCRMFDSFRETAMHLGRTDLLEHCTSYRAAKDAAEPFKTTKQLLYRKFRAGGYGTWVTKPLEEEMFTFPAAAPAAQKLLNPPRSAHLPGSAPMSGISPQLSSVDTVDDSSEDFT